MSEPQRRQKSCDKSKYLCIQENKNSDNFSNIALSKSYLSNLTAGEVLSMQTNNDDINLAVRFFSLGQIVNNKNENMRDKLSNVFHSVWNADGSILLLIKGKKDSTEIYIGIKNVLFDGSDDAINHTSLLSEILENNLTANFPGTKSKRDEINETHDDKALSNIQLEKRRRPESQACV